LSRPTLLVRMLSRPENARLLRSKPPPGFLQTNRVEVIAWGITAEDAVIPPPSLREEVIVLGEWTAFEDQREQCRYVLAHCERWRSSRNTGRPWHLPDAFSELATLSYCTTEPDERMVTEFVRRSNFLSFSVYLESRTDRLGVILYREWPKLAKLLRDGISPEEQQRRTREHAGEGSIPEFGAPPLST